MGLEPHQNFFQIFFSTNMVARGVQSFCILEGAADPLIDQLLNSFVNLPQTCDEQTRKISSQYLKRFQNYGYLTEKFGNCPPTFVRIGLFLTNVGGRLVGGQLPEFFS